MRPTLFLDFDDVLCLNAPYGGDHIRRSSQEPLPVDFWPNVFHGPSKEVLLAAMAEHAPRVVLTTSWLRFLERPGFEAIFKRTGLEVVAESLHDCWDAPQGHVETRATAISSWLKKHHNGEPFVVLDDQDSGTGLRESKHYKTGRVVLCVTAQGLQQEHLPAIRKALAR